MSESHPPNHLTVVSPARIQVTIGGQTSLIGSWIQRYPTEAWNIDWTESFGESRKSKITFQAKHAKPTYFDPYGGYPHESTPEQKSEAFENLCSKHQIQSKKLRLCKFTCIPSWPPGIPGIPFSSGADPPRAV